MEICQRVDLLLAQQSERFDRLDSTHKQIFTALINAESSEKGDLQAQISALSLLLDRAEVVIAHQENLAQRIIVDVFRELSIQSQDTRAAQVIDRVGSEDRLLKRVQNEILERLWFSNMTDRLEAIPEAHKKTFQWIFKSPEDTKQFASGRTWSDFKDWLQHGSDLYWVSGKAGSGKSTLMKYIFSEPYTRRYLADWAGDIKLYVAGFFFWNSGTTKQKSQYGLFRSLLYNVLHETPELIPTAFPKLWALSYSAICQGLSSDRGSSVSILLFYTLYPCYPLLTVVR